MKLHAYDAVNLVLIGVWPGDSMRRKVAGQPMIPEGKAQIPASTTQISGSVA
jgi:hypothetical protein